MKLISICKLPKLKFMFRTLLLIALGGGVGSMLRYLTSMVVGKFYTSVFPLATLTVNVIGCLLVGFFMGWLGKNELADGSMKWLLITGFCGGYTTFSTFGYENIALLQSQHSGIAFLYIAGSVMVGLAAVWLGLWLSE